MWMIALVPFFLQAVVMLIDEGYFHLKRGLPRWERLGHPLDTLSFLACLLFVVWVPFSWDALWIYITLTIFSCLMVTKDEFVHADECEASEHWLHALLFLLHPITLTMSGLLWPVVSQVETISWLNNWLLHRDILLFFLYTQLVSITLFFFYQIFYWNFIRHDQQSVL